jgi:hypothetical protein
LKNLTLLLVLFFLVQGYSQQYSFINYGVKDGLAQSQVTDICQDHLGYLWVGTQSGLSKFDGQTFTNFSKIDGLIDNTVQKLLYDKEKKVLWIASPKGMTKLDFTSKKLFNTYSFESTHKINDLLLINDTLFIATNTDLISFYDNTFNYIPNDLRIRSMTYVDNETFLLATRNGMYSFKNRRFIRFKDSTLNYNFSKIKYYEDGLLLSTYNNGIIKYNLKTQQKIALTEPIRIITFIKHKNKIWAVSDQSVLLLENKMLKKYTTGNGLPEVKLKCLFVDNENNLWIGTYGKGLLKFSTESVLSYSTKNGLSSDIIMSINQNQKGDFAFGSYDNGMVIFTKEGQKYYYTYEDLNSRTVWSIIEMDKNDFLIASTGGLSKVENYKLINKPDCAGKFKTLFKVNKTIFVGGKSGLWLLNDKGFNRVEKSKKYDINKVFGNSTKLYLASKNGLFWTYISDSVTQLNPIELPENDCNSITIDAFNNLWVGTIDGLYIVSPNHSIIEYQLDSLDFKSRNILGLITSKDKDIWASTTNGLYLLEKGNPFNEKLEKYHYSEAEGITDLESNLNALYEDHLGFIWLGTSSALYKINPRLKDELFLQKPPNLSIESIKLFKENFPYSKYAKSYDSLSNIPTNIVLPPKQNHLTFEFIGINLKNPKHVMYSYRLKGAEEKWSPLSSDHTATYSFISPGNYVFEVKATNDGINWTPIKSIDIEIEPFFWQRWWFILGGLIFVLLIGYLLFILRVRALKRKKDNEKLVFKNRLRELEQQSLNASMNRHFIFNSLNSIQYFINSSDKRSANKFLSNFAKLIRKNLDSSTADNFMVNLDEEIERIDLYLSLEKMRFGDKFDFEINVDEDVDVEMTKVPSMILQPFVENSIIHGILPNNKKGLIQINIHNQPDSLEFEVIDNGVGIDESSDNKSDFAGDHESKGMKITENRIELIRKINGGKLMIIGPFQLNDEQGKSKGTKVIIKLPLNGIK